VDLADREPELEYWIGSTYYELGDAEQAKKHWRKSAGSESSVRKRQNLPGIRPREIQNYYQALSLRELGETEQAATVLRELVASASRAVESNTVRLSPDASVAALRDHRSTLAAAHYAAGLGYLGLNEREKARDELTKALKERPDHAGAKAALAGAS
jgi:tetratricopeptide (TPR) repeat protein